jgi:hypothetical protein
MIKCSKYFPAINNKLPFLTMPAPVVDPADALRDKARRCRRLAAGIGDDQARAALEAMAAELEAQAEALEAQKGLDGGFVL